MRLCFRSVLIFLSVVFCGLAAATIPSSPVYKVYAGGSYHTGSSPAEACAKAGPLIPPSVFTFISAAPSGGNCVAQTVENGSYSQIIEGPTYSCPANSSPVSGGCACNSGSLEQGGQCVDPNQACKAKSGTSSIVNVTVAWQRTPSVASGVDWLYPTKLSPSGTGSACNGGCMQNFDAHEPCSDCGSYVSQVPNSQGLYRVSIDFMGHYSGSVCSDSPSDQVIKPDDSKDPPCPGFVGEVNGVKGCYGTADKPIRPSAPDPNVDKNGKDQGNPAAGTKPTSGSGSGSGGAGRTPGAGSGGSAGGPAGAAGGSGTKPDGTKPTEEGKEQQNCGAPGQPRCAIDETGTPKGKEDTATVDAQKTIKPLDDFVKNPTSFLPTFPTINWAFTLPTGCSPIALTAFAPWLQSIDICEWLPMFHDLMSFIWVMGGIFGAIGTFWRNTFSQG